MSRLPTSGSDNGTWGDILNDFLGQSHSTDGTLKDGVVTNSKLDSATQSNISGKYTKPGAGIPKTDLDSFTQTSLTKADAAAQKASNLTDLASASSARTALGLGSAAVMTPTSIAADAALTGTYAAMVAAPTGVSATDSAAVQAAHDALPAGGGVLRLQRGTYDLTAGVTLSKQVTVQGEGGPSSVAFVAATTIQCASATATPITVTAHGVTLRDFALVCTAATPSAGAGIAVTTGAGNGMRYESIGVKGFYVDIDHRAGAEWYMEKCFIFDPVLYGLKIQNVDLADGGDMGISNCQFIAGPAARTPGALIRQESGGGLRLTGCKMNQRGSGKATYGLDVAIADGALTGVLVVTGNSLENLGTAAIRLGQAGPSNTGRLNYVTITGNEIVPYTANATGILISPAADGLMNNITIAGNTIAATTPISLANCDYITISGNQYAATAWYNAVTVGAGVTNLNHTPPDAIGASQVTSASVLTNETTASTSYTDLATPGPAVTATIGASGNALVIVGCQVAVNAGAGATKPGYMGFAISGTTTRAASTDTAYEGAADYTAGAYQKGSNVAFVTGLTPGSNTFTAKYVVDSGTGNFQRRRITVIPL